MSQKQAREGIVGVVNIQRTKCRSLQKICSPSIYQSGSKGSFQSYYEEQKYSQHHKRHKTISDSFRPIMQLETV